MSVSDPNGASTREVIDLLWVARQSLIDHASQLPLKRRDHGPVLVRIDAMIERLATDAE
jgi:hypothetical protein